MSVDQATVRKIAQLARLSVPEERLSALEGELNRILDFVEQLNAVDTDGVAPMTSAVDTALRWREDRVDDGDCQEQVLANAPDAQYGFYAVPKVIE